MIMNFNPSYDELKDENNTLKKLLHEAKEEYYNYNKYMTKSISRYYDIREAIEAERDALKEQLNAANQESNQKTDLMVKMLQAWSDEMNRADELEKQLKAVKAERDAEINTQKQGTHFFTVHTLFILAVI